MVQKVTVTLEDDLSGGPATETVRFAVGGTDYEIDLNAKSAAAFRRQLRPYLEHARRAGRAPGRRAGRTAASRRRSGEIRAWAKERGLAVSERGRIPASVMEQYQAAGRGRSSSFEYPVVSCRSRRSSCVSRSFTAKSNSTLSHYQAIRYEDNGDTHNASRRPT